MVTNAIQFVENVLGWIVTQFDKLLDSIPGSVELLIVIFAIYTTARLLLKPIVGMSDGVVGVSKRNKVQNKSKSSTSED